MSWHIPKASWEQPSDEQSTWLGILLSVRRIRLAHLANTHSYSAVLDFYRWPWNSNVMIIFSCPNSPKLNRSFAQPLGFGPCGLRHKHDSQAEADEAVSEGCKSCLSQLKSSWIMCLLHFLLRTNQRILSRHAIDEGHLLPDTKTQPPIVTGRTQHLWSINAAAESHRKCAKNLFDREVPE